jgi:hypothetical protein
MKTFKIRAAKGQKEYWVVRVHNNWVKLFLAFYKMSGVPENFLAVCIRNKKGKNKMGEIMFTKKHATPEIVSHELAHAANYYMELKKKKIVFDTKDDGWKENDEMYATMVGDMVGQFWRKYK